MLPNPITAGSDTQLSKEVRAFCQRHQLLDPLAKAIELAKRCFSMVGEPSVQLEQDPEDGEWYLVLEILVKGEEHECIQAHKEYVWSWANSTPWPAVHMIRLFVDNIEE
jgi:hypothetical protein